MEKVGFIGLGIMGEPMAKNLIKGGCSLLVNDIDRQAVEKLTAVGAVYASPSEIGKACNLVFTMLPTGAIVQQVLFGEDGVASTLQAGSLVLDTSSVTQMQSIECAQQLKSLGAEFLDCPVSGGEPGAINATLAFMCGGTPAAFKRALPYFNLMGSSALLVGPTGSGSVAKLANQIIVNLNIATVAEALVFAAKAGTDPEKVYQAIKGGLAGSAVLEAKAPMMLSHNFKPGGKLSINHKDIANVVQAAHSLDVPIPLTAQLFEIMQTLKASGHMQEDHSALVAYFEMLANISL